MDSFTARKIFAFLPTRMRYLMGELIITSISFDPRMFRDYTHGVLATKFNYRNDYISKVLNLKNCHKGARCFILGNGPSLNKTDLNKLKEEISFGSNGIFHIFKETDYRPTYFTVVDFIFAKNYSKTINKIIKQKNITGILLNSLRKYINGDDTTIWVNFLPTWANGHPLQYNPENLAPHFKWPLLPEFSEDIIRGIHDAGTVTYINLQLALYMGFKEIYLVGVDHNYKIDKALKTEYEDILVSDYEVDPNHFNPNYTPKGHTLTVPRMHIMERCYYAARKVAEKRNVKIFNATKGGHLGVFKRVNYDSLF
ncbi:MAG: 6-hydroxymethylpterin diphosphokinase MptE-like protein [Candidatus Hodarchaeales archaeon]